MSCGTHVAKRNRDPSWDLRTRWGACRHAYLNSEGMLPIWRPAPLFMFHEKCIRIPQLLPTSVLPYTGSSHKHDVVFLSTNGYPLPDRMTGLLHHQTWKKQSITTRRQAT